MTLLEVAPQPELDGRLIFAGEHTSGDFSGFMNGAVQSGNRAAKEILEPKKNPAAESRVKPTHRPLYCRAASGIDGISAFLRCAD